MGRLKDLAIRLLRRGERFTGTDNVYLTKGGVLLSIASTVASMSSLILAMLFARYVGKDAYGTYQYLLSWGSIFAIFSVTGLSDALTRAVAQGHDGTIGVVLATRLRWSLLAVAVGAAVAGWYLAHGRLDLALGFLAVAAFLPANAALSTWADYALGKKAFGWQTRVSACVTLASTACVVAAIFLRPTPLGLTLTFSVAYLAANALGLLLTLRKFPPREPAADDAVAFGRKLTALDLISSVATYFDRIVIFALLGARDTAIYAFAIAPPEQLKGYLKNLYAMALPKVAARPLAEMRPTFFRKFLLLLLGVAAVSLAYILAAPWIYRWLFPGYVEAVGYSMLFATSLVGISSILPVAVFNGHKKYAENLKYQVSSSILGIALLALSVWKWGLWGAVAARVVTRYLALAYAAVLVDGVFKEASPAAAPNHRRDDAGHRDQDARGLKRPG